MQKKRINIKKDEYNNLFVFKFSLNAAKKLKKKYGFFGSGFMSILLFYPKKILAFRHSIFK
jgi:hypothetical protein